MKRRSPVLAMVLAMGAFIATSMIFNLVFEVAAFMHVDRFLGGFLQGIAFFAAFLLVFPFAFQAARSRVSPRFVAFVASMLLGGIYFVAVRNEIVLFTHYLFPHIPGKELRAETVGLIVLIAVFVAIATYLSKPELGSDEDTRKSSADRTDEATEAATEVVEGVAEGIIEQIGHHH